MASDDNGADDSTLNLFDVHGVSPSPDIVPTESIDNTESKTDDTSSSITTTTTSDDKVITLPFNTQSLIRAVSDKLYSSTPNSPNAVNKVSVETPIQNNTESPQPNHKNNLNVTLDRFSKEDLFKLFGKARKEARVHKLENEALKSKNSDIFKALNACNEQNEILQVTNVHLRKEYNALKEKSLNFNTDSLEKYNKLEQEMDQIKGKNEEKMALIKTQCASYMNEVNRLNEQIQNLKKENDLLSTQNENIQSKIGEQYSSFSKEINGLKTQCNEYLQKEIEQNERIQILSKYEEEITKYKEIARNAATDLDRISSLEEELREKIRQNHKLQIQTRSFQQNIEKMSKKLDTQTQKLSNFEATNTQKIEECEKLNAENSEYKKDLTLLNEKMNILLKENAENTLKNEQQIERIEAYHLSKYKALLRSFKMMKKRMDANKKSSDYNGDGAGGNKRLHNVGYSNNGWKQFHNDYQPNFSQFDDAMDIDSNMNDLQQNIAKIHVLNAMEKNENDNGKSVNSKREIRKCHIQIKEYQNMIKSLQKQLVNYQNKCVQNEDKLTMNKDNVSSRTNKQQNVNIDYLRNVLVKFLILSEYLTDDQIVLVPVLGSILRLSVSEKQMIDASYNSSRYFMGTETLFPESANAKHSPLQRRKRKKKTKRRDRLKVSKTNTGDSLATV